MTRLTFRRTAMIMRVLGGAFVETAGTERGAISLRQLLALSDKTVVTVLPATVNLAVSVTLARTLPAKKDVASANTATPSPSDREPAAHR